MTKLNLTAQRQLASLLAFASNPRPYRPSASRPAAALTGPGTTAGPTNRRLGYHHPRVKARFFREQR